MASEPLGDIKRLSMRAEYRKNPLLAMCFCVVGILAVSLSASAQVVTRDVVQHIIAEKLLAGQELLFARNYTEAMKLFKAMEAAYPTSPAGYFGEMATVEVQMLERDDFHLEREFEDAARRGAQAVSRVMQSYRPTTFELMFGGSLYGLHGFLKARKGEWLTAYFLGSKSRQLFRRIQTTDPHFVDADFGIGMYLYWRSVFTKELPFLPFFPDRREEGIKLVTRVAERGWLSKDLALVNLGIMNLEERHPAKAIKILHRYVERYPHNVILHSLLGRAYVAGHKYDEAVVAFEQALQLEPMFHRAHYFMAIALVLKKDAALLPRAEQELDRFMATSPSQEWQSYVHYWRGMIAEVRGDKIRARKEYEVAIEMNSHLKGAKFRLRGLGGGL
ncbi:MAG: tetratricopeptide repeat protein [Deltaproteobacteria bacterium]|nr:tetratricopeptide repeat protein [Deltaproteobacteria bacterium]